MTCPRGVADRVNLGLIPTAEGSYPAACRALNQERGGVLHIHHNVKRTDDFGECEFKNKISEGKDFDCKHEEWRNWSYATAAKIGRILEGLETVKKWRLELMALTRVKSYAPRVDHMVLDLKCIFEQ